MRAALSGGPMCLRPHLHLDVKACAATAAARGQRVVDNLELGPDKLHGEVDLAALEQLERGGVKDDLGRGQVRAGACPLLIGRVGEDGVVFADLGFLSVGGRLGSGREGWREGDEAHEVLEAVAAAGLDLYPEGQVGICVLGHDFRQALGRGRG